MEIFNGLEVVKAEASVLEKLQKSWIKIQRKYKRSTIDEEFVGRTEFEQESWYPAGLYPGEPPNFVVENSHVTGLNLSGTLTNLAKYMDEYEFFLHAGLASLPSDFDTLSELRFVYLEWCQFKHFPHQLSNLI